MFFIINNRNISNILIPKNIDTKQELQQATLKNPEYVFKIISSSFERTYFTLSKRRIMRNSFNPVFYGSVSGESENRVLSGKFIINKGKLFLIITSIVFPILLLIYIYFSADRTPVKMVIHGINGVSIKLIPWWAPCMFCIAFLVIVVLYSFISITIQNRKRNDIEQFIRSIFCGSET